MGFQIRWIAYYVIELANDNSNCENKRNFLESLQEFAYNNPLSSLGKMLKEFLCFSLTEQEKDDINFFALAFFVALLIALVTF